MKATKNTGSSDSEMVAAIFIGAIIVAVIWLITDFLKGVF